MPGFVEAQHPRGPGGKFRAALAARAKKYRQAGAAKLAAFRLQEAARVKTKLQEHDAETERLAAGAGAKAGQLRAARDRRRQAIEERSAARVDEARRRIRASVRYEHELGKLHGQPYEVQDRAWHRWLKRKGGERVRGNDALKAAIARAKANGPRKVDVRQDHLTGKIVSKRSKTGNPACSAAMSAWKLGRGTPEVHAMLAKCRAMAAGRRQAMLARAGGNEARAQHLEHRSKQGMTGKERLTKAKELAEKRRAAKVQAESTPAPKASNPVDLKPSTRAMIQRARNNRDVLTAEPSPSGRWQLRNRVNYDIYDEEYATQAEAEKHAALGNAANRIRIAQNKRSGKKRRANRPPPLSQTHVMLSNGRDW